MKIVKLFLSVAVAFSSTALSTTALAETIHLKDGSTITGKIKSITPEQVVIVTVIGERTIDSGQISQVDEKTVPSQDSVSKSYPESHMQQKNGFGFGPSISSLIGINIFYDRNLSEKSQLHVQLNGNAGGRYNSFGEEVIATSRGMALTTYRYFPAENNGFYLGAGGGYAHSTLKYESTTLLGSTPYQYTANLSGIFLLGEIGWQGKDGYYFSVGFQPAAYISSKDDYDVNKIPDTSNHRVAANEEHDKLKKISQISIGFGWFF